MKDFNGGLRQRSDDSGKRHRKGSLKTIQTGFQAAF
jgi:hypothetical protein